MRNCAACIWRARDCSSRFCPLPRCPFDTAVPWWESMARRMKARRKALKLRRMASKLLALGRAPAPEWVRGREV